MEATSEAAVARERERQRAKSAARAAAERDIAPREVGNPERRAACQYDDALWLQTYLPDVFYHPFTADQLAIIREIGRALKYGTAKCIAAPRGDGKSSITRYLILKYALYRQIRFGLLLCSTGPKADEALKSIKAKLRQRSGPLYEDFPLESDVAAYVGPAPARAHNATVDGERIHAEWSASRLILPTIEGAPVGPIVMAMGIESEQLQGCNVLDQRPDFVMLDDLDSRESLAAVDGVMAGKIEEIIDKNVAGLGGPGRRLGQVYLCTITSPRSAAFRYSDPTIKPAWSGIRLPRIKQWPDRIDLWERYIELRQAGQNTRIDPKDPSSPPRDPFGREAFRLYRDNRDDMDRGSVLSNQYDFSAGLLPDGTPTHLSALQKCYDYIADSGMESFQTEHQNSPPPADEHITKAGITKQLVASRMSGLPRYKSPASAVLVAGIDIGQYRCHVVYGAARQGGIVNIVHYDTLQVHDTEGADNVEVVHAGILRTLSEWREGILAEPFKDSDGNPLPLSKVNIDAGKYGDAVYEFVKRFGEPFRATKGASAFQHGTPSQTRRIGNHWFAQPVSGLWLYSLDPNYWKLEVHNRFLAEPFDAEGKPAAGSLSLFEPANSRDHDNFARQIVAEEWVTEFVPGKGEKAKWLKVSNNNHFLDATSMMLAAADMAGFGLFAKPRHTGPRRKLSEVFAERAKPRAL